LRLDCITVDNLVSQAFGTAGISPHEVEAMVKGGPAWVSSRRFTIEAVTKEPVTTRELRSLLLQDVLEQRFQLRVHEETRMLPVYELIQVPGGAKLQRTKDGSCVQLGEGKPGPQSSGGKAPPPVCGDFRRARLWGGVDVYGVSMGLLCRRLSNGLDRDVVDKTGLQGIYDFHLDTTLEELPLFMARGSSVPAQPDAASEPSGSPFTAVRKLGLRLTRSTKPSKVIVIDRVEMPSAN
jgi:uncharacterized protein (TIGR03435 family)